MKTSWLTIIKDRKNQHWAVKWIAYTMMKVSRLIPGPEEVSPQQQLKPDWLTRAPQSPLICKVVLSSSASSGRELHLFTSKRSHCPLFFLSVVVLCKGGQRSVFKRPGTLKFPRKTWAPGLFGASCLSFLPVWKHITGADPSLRTLRLYVLTKKGHVNVCDSWEGLCKFLGFLLHR